MSGIMAKRGAKRCFARGRVLATPSPEKTFGDTLIDGAKPGPK